MVNMTSSSKGDTRSTNLLLQTLPHKLVTAVVMLKLFYWILSISLYQSWTV